MVKAKISWLSVHWFQAPKKHGSFTSQNEIWCLLFVRPYLSGKCPHLSNSTPHINRFPFEAQAKITLMTSSGLFPQLLESFSRATKDIIDESISWSMCGFNALVEHIYTDGRSRNIWVGICTLWQMKSVWRWMLFSLKALVWNWLWHGSVRPPQFGWENAVWSKFTNYTQRITC